MATCVIYIPGLADNKWESQYGLVNFWKVWGVTPVIFRMNWTRKQPFARKFSKLLDIVDELYEQGHRVSLVGVSAGASVAVNVFAARPRSIHRVVLLCGKLQHPETVSPYTYQANPAFRESMDMVEASLTTIKPKQRERIVSIHPLGDGAVPPSDTIIAGALEKTIPTFGHGASIFFGLTLYGFSIARFCK